MKFCTYLFNDLNFEPTCIQPCCDTHSIGVPSFPYTGGELDLDAYKKHITDVFWKLQVGSSFCQGCTHLQDTDVTFENEVSRSVGQFLKIRTVSFNQHRFFCNCRCVYCTLWSHLPKEKPYSVFNVVKTLVGSGVLHPECVFSWGGGEPSILPEFDTVCSWITTQGYSQYVHSSALVYSKSVKALLQKNAGRINVSLDAGSCEQYGLVKGVDGWSKVVNCLERYVRDAVCTSQIDLKYIIFEQTNSLREIMAFLELSKALGIQYVQFSLDFREVNTATVSKKTLVAAAFFKKHARDLGLVSQPFFVDAPLLTEIEHLETEL